MNLRNFLLTGAAAVLLGTGAYLLAEAGKPGGTTADFDAKITRDTSEPTDAPAHLHGFADVVQRILPSVVSISTYSKKAPGRGFGGLGEDDLNRIPPWFRQWFEDQMERDGQVPRRRPQPQQPRKPVQTGLGSGVLLTEDGYILTNNHVVADADELKVMVGDKTSKEYNAKVIGTDPQSDVALIKIEGKGFPHATIGDSSKLRVGDIVLAVGSPMGLEQSVTHGIVSALGRSDIGIIAANRGMAGYENFIQTDAAINPGNSGGPLVDAHGRVVGINTAIETRSGMFAGIGLAIPINMALNNVHDLLAGGKVQRGFLGIQMGEVDPSMIEFLGLKDETGVTVSMIVPDSPAAKAGFLEGDVIVSAQGQKVQDLFKLRLMISSQRPGTEVKFGVVRMNENTRKPERREIVAKLDRLPDDPNLAVGKPKPAESPSPAGSFLQGVRVENITDELRQTYEIEPDVKGVVVTSVDEKSAAWKVGLEEGDVITQVNRKPVTTLAEARESRGQPGEIVQLKIVRKGQTKFLAVKN